MRSSLQARVGCKPCAKNQIARGARSRSTAVKTVAFLGEQQGKKGPKQLTKEEERQQYVNSLAQKNNVLAMILGGGPGDYDKLFPLTEKRALPAVPVGGAYRLVDLPISSCINSGITKMYILTQFQSQSLNKYLATTYNLSGGIPLGTSGFIETLSVTQYPQGHRWSQGTADAVRQFSWILQDARAERQIRDVIILAADQLYRTDFGGALMEHRKSGADVTILCCPCDEEQAEHMGVVQVACSKMDMPFNEGTQQAACWIHGFDEKPKGSAKSALKVNPDVMESFQTTSRSAAAAFDVFGKVSRGTMTKNTTEGHDALDEQADEINSMGKDSQQPFSQQPYLASTGIYIFNRKALIKMLNEFGDANDFGQDLLPRAVANGYKVLAVEFVGPWRDVGGSILDFWKASMEIARDGAHNLSSTVEPAKLQAAKMAQPSPTFFDPIQYKQTLFKAPESLPATNYLGKSSISTSFVAPGCVIGNNVKISSSIIGNRAIIGNNCTIDEAVVMGADYYGEGENGGELGIGNNCEIRRAIIDKNARIGDNVQLVNKGNQFNSGDYQAIGVYIRSGIIVVRKGAVVPDGTII